MKEDKKLTIYLCFFFCSGGRASTAARPEALYADQILPNGIFGGNKGIMIF